MEIWVPDVGIPSIVFLLIRWPNVKRPVDKNFAKDGFSSLAPSALRGLPFPVILFASDLAILFNSRGGFLSDTADVATLEELFDEIGLRPNPDDILKKCRQALSTGKTTQLQRLRYGPVQDDEFADAKLLDLCCSALRDEAGEVTGGVLVLEDGTERAILEKRLAFYERLAMVGKLAAKIAHELNNPLDGILRFVNLALRVKEEGDPAQRYLEHARKGLMRMVRVVRELLEFSRSTMTAFEHTSVNAMLEETLRSMEGQANTHRVKIETDFTEKLPTIRSGDLVQVFCNLVKNAIHVMPEGGLLRVTSSTDGENIFVRFADSGPGISEEIREKVFEPFFTTKRPGEGTGLGLAISRDIVEKYGGSITIEDGQEGGTVFVVRIPLKPPPLPGT